MNSSDIIWENLCKTLKWQKKKKITECSVLCILLDYL